MEPQRGWERQPISAAQMAALLQEVKWLAASPGPRVPCVCSPGVASSTHPLPGTCSFVLSNHSEQSTVGSGVNGQVLRGHPQRPRAQPTTLESARRRSLLWGQLSPRLVVRRPVPVLQQGLFRYGCQCPGRLLPAVVSSAVTSHTPLAHLARPCQAHPRAGGWVLGISQRGPQAAGSPPGEGPGSLLPALPPDSPPASLRGVPIQPVT